jgi:multicomponent Na+:H+ antiporter subunit D
MTLPWLLLAPLTGLVATLSTTRAARWQAGLILAMSLASLGLATGLFLAGAPMTTAVGGWSPPYGIRLHADMFGRLMLVTTGLVFSLAALYHLGQSLRAAPPTRNAVYHLSFPLLLLALNGLFATRDFFNFYVFFELLAVSSYLLVAMGKHAPLEAAWKYSAQSVLGSIFLLVGVVSLYGSTGALEMGEVASRLAGPAREAAPFLLIAFLLKGAIFPFHFWQPDAHAAATTAGSALLAGLLISVGMAALLRFWPLLMGATRLEILLALGATSLLFGAAAAWKEADAKRMLGFSSVSQLGFVLLALGWGSTAALGAAILYLISHALAKALLFLVTGALADSVGSTRFADLRGQGRDMPWLGAAYLVGSLSLIGLPPTLGFVAKVGLLGAGVAAHAWLGVAIAAVGSLMTAAYTLKAYLCLFWEDPDPERPPPEKPSAWTLAAVGTGTSLVLLGILGAEPLRNACMTAAAELMTPGFPR